MMARAGELKNAGLRQMRSSVADPGITDFSLTSAYLVGSVP